MWHQQLDNSWGYLVALFVCCALVSDLRYDIRRIVRGRSVVLCGILSWYVLEGISLSIVLNEYDQSTYNYSVFCVLLSAIGFLLGYHLCRPTALFDSVAIRTRQLDNPELLWRVVVFCALLGFAPIVYFSGMQLAELFRGILGMRDTWGGLIGRARYGGLRDALLMLEYFVKGASPLAVVLLLTPRLTAPRKVVCAIVAIWPLLTAYGSATRSAMLQALLPVLAVIYFKSPARLQRTMIVGSVLCLPTLYFFMAAIAGSRNSGTLDWEAGNKVHYVGNEMLQEMAYISKNVPAKVGYQLGYSYYVQLVNPIPRFLWPGKPTLETGIFLAQLKGAVDESGEVVLTNSPGLIGEMYLNFGLLGIFGLSMLGGWLVRGWDRLMERHQDSLCTMIFYVMGLAALFLLGRSFGSFLFYGMLFFYFGVWAVVRFMGNSLPNRGMSNPYQMR